MSTLWVCEGLRKVIYFRLSSFSFSFCCCPAVAVCPRPDGARNTIPYLLYMRKNKEDELPGDTKYEKVVVYCTCEQGIDAFILACAYVCTLRMMYHFFLFLFLAKQNTMPARYMTWHIL